ncbi:MAG TPA: hypothetical protein VJM50_16430 [Pyrinomonadaceae bacterium]|nr:hypothetical protein [Pyrinomonadaceae bacterium]
MRTSVDDANSPLGGGDKFLAFIEQELIPFIDSKNKKKHLRWATYSTPHAVHANNARISTSRGLVEWGAYLKTNSKK